MSKNVCMFVWNHFTNDARVLRECTALSESGYKVDLICIHDPNDKNMPFVEMVNENFIVHRVKRYPTSLIIFQKCLHIIKKQKVTLIPLIVFWCFTLYKLPIVTLLLTFFSLLLLQSKVKKALVVGSVALRMIAKGYKRKYSFYHANDLNTLPQAYVCSKLRLRRKKLIYDSHEVQTSRTGYGPLHGKLEKVLIKKIDTMIVENHTRAKFNEELYGFYPKVVHNYPFKQKAKIKNKINLHKLLNLPQDEKILLYQGGIQTGRGLDKLIDAVPLITEGCVVLIGDGKIKPILERKVKDMGLHERVRFIPKVPLKDLPAYTENAYLGFQILNNVCFNHYSASSNKLFEYMMAGVPVVACNFPEIKKVVEVNKIGICVDSHDFVEIAKAVNQIICDPKLRNTYSKNAKKSSEYYNWDSEKEDFLRNYIF